MKTQIEKTENKRQTINNELILIAIWILLAALFIAAVSEKQRTVLADNNAIRPSKAGLYSAIFFADIINGERSDVSYLQYIQPKKAVLSLAENRKLETARLIANGSSFRLLNAVQSEIEPALEMNESSSFVLFKDDEADAGYTVKENDYLNRLLREKNEEIFLALEEERLLGTETENALAVESWMTDKAWQMSDEETAEFENFLDEELRAKNNEVYATIEKAEYFKRLLVIETEQPLEMEAWLTQSISPNAPVKGTFPNDFLAGLLASKNNEVFRNISLQCKCHELLALENEAPLEVEDWMVDERCWCPNKKQSEHFFAEPYAMNNDE